MSLRLRAPRFALLAFGNFSILGLHVGVHAVQLAPLSASIGLTPGMLGAAITTAALAGVVTLFAGGRLADRLGRRPVLVAGYGGTAAGFLLLTRADDLAGLFAGMLVYGLFSSFIDLGANTVGADVEAESGRHLMTSLHAGFSGGAAVGALATALALTAGVDYRAVYVALAVVLAAAGVVVALVAFPGVAGAHPGVETADAPLESAVGARPEPGWERGAVDGRAASTAVWRIPAVVFAIALVTVTFFGDGALESFLAVYLRDTLGSTILLSGLGVAAFHAASLTGRLVFSRILGRLGERRVVVGAGLLASAGTAVAVLTGNPVVAVIGLLVVGFAVSPIVPVTLSLAARSAPGRSGRAVAATTTVGYTAFIVGPSVVGAVTTATDLRVGLGMVVASTLVVAVLGSRWPERRVRESTGSGGSGASGGTQGSVGAS